ncbi:MAG: hypothetical protein AB1324_03315 [Candidatus Micrarchaeota archaeon]
MKTLSVILLLGLVILAGCAQQQPPVEPPQQPPVQPPAQEASIRLLPPPASVGAGESFQLSWEVSGPQKTITHTAVHYGSESKPGKFGTGVGPDAAGYPGLSEEFASGSFSVPGNFTANINAPSVPGRLYFRAHAIIDGKHYWTDEMSVEVTGGAEPAEPSISVVAAPSTAASGKNFNVTWNVSGPAGTIMHTAVHYDTVSHPGDFGTDVGPAQSGYPSLTPEFASVESAIPDDFTASIAAPSAPGKIYYRAHAIVGGKHYWTEERTVEVTAPAAETKEFTVEADDNAFYPPSPIQVNEGDMVKITFVVRSSNVYFGGLDFRSPKFKTAALKPGESGSVEFVADESFTITSYWPASGVRKSDLSVEVS